MDCKEEIVDVRIPHPEEFEKGKALMQKVFKLNQTMPYTEEYFKALKEVFEDNLGENSIVNAPIQGAWIGAGATIMPGICIGKHAIVGAASVVTHDVPNYSVVVGNPARVIKTLDETKFNKKENKNFK